MLVHVTPNAENQMHEAGQLDRLKTMREECSSRDGSFVVDRAYRKRHPRYVFRWGQYRGFAGLYEVCGTEVLSILACIRRGADAHYSQLLTGFLGGENVITEPSEEELKAFVDSEEGPPPPPPPSLPDEYRGWLLPPRWVTASVEASEEGPGRKELVVYETRAWVDAMRGIGEFHWRPIHEELQRIHDELSRGGALEDLPSMEVSSPGVWRLRTEQGVGHVAFSVFDVTGPTARRILFLLTPSWPANRDAQDELLLRHHPALADEGCSDAEPTVDDIAPFAARSYLGYLLWDEDAWRRVQEDTGANLALSSEEEELLSELGQIGDGCLPLPSFIHGRAGSGKSTMLYYLFADYCDRKRPGREEAGVSGEPLFLTYSPELTKVARDAVGQLLAAHGRFLEQGPDATPPRRLDDWFQPFENFCLSLLPPESRRRFPLDKRIDFPQFRTLYLGDWLTGADGQTDRAAAPCRLTQARNISPHVAWHTIRSLIKGYSADDYLEANDYAEIPVGHRSVTEETFRTVHDEIWRKWYQAVNQDGYWDSQDLIRELIKTGSYGDGHPVIFCDEAQDFTPIEMHFIRRLSIFSRYRLGPERIQCLPLALAGDPCQTITPTGFRWESVTSGFHTEVLEMLPWHQRPGFRLRHCALTRNYRCMAGIVRLANLILLWRHQYLGTSSLEPQRFWRRQAEVTPKVRVLSDQVSPREFSDALSNLVVVVPVEAQEIPGYVRNDPLLAPLCERLTGADAGRPGNVFSAMMVKGMEFERVVLYKFGKHIPNAMPWDRGARNEAATETDDSDIEAGYFLNRLYVALTRAKTELLVFDDEQGCDALWDRADDRSIEELLQLMDPTQRDRWRRLVGGIRRDSGWNVNQIAASDPASVAKELEERGEEANDADALASAAYFFNRAGEARRADLCRAKELRARGQYAAAGDAFLSRGDHDEALRCYWDGCCWHQLAKLTQDLPDEVRPELRRFAAFMTSTQSDFDHLTAVADEINELRERVVRRYGVPAWREIGGQLAHRAMQLADQGQPNQWVKIAVALRILADGGYRGYEEPARAYVRAGNYPEAVKLFELSGKTDEDDYFWAKAAVVGAPDGLAWLSRMASRQQAASEAFRLWEAAGGFAARDRNKWLQTGGQLLRTREEFWSALRSFVAASLSLDELEEVLNLVPDQGQVDQQVVAQWRASQGHTQDDTDRWLRHVAPRLERMGAYAEAFRAYASMPGGLRDARHCLSKAAQTWSDAEVQDAVAMLLHRAAQDEPERVASVLHACMDQYPQAAAAAHRLRCEAIRQLASSSMQRDPSLSHRETEDLVAAVTEAGGWEEHVQWFEVGAVLERCGSLARSVEFYHHWQSRLTGDQQQAARRRWLSVRMRQAQYHRSQRQTDQAETIERLFEHQASAWGIPRASIQPDYPVLVPTQDRAPTVQGLPPKTPVSVSPEGRVEFSVDGLRCLADGTSHVVMLTDESTLQVLRIDARSMQIQTIGSASPEGMVEIPGGLRCRFPGTNRMIAVRAHDERREVVIETRAENVTVSLPCG